MVDEKTAEAEFFIGKMCSSSDQEFRFYFSAFLSAARTVTFTLQRFNHIPEFEDWYKAQRTQMSKSPLARYFKLLRDKHVHGDNYPVGGSVTQYADTKYFFDDYKDSPKPPTGYGDLVSAARAFFLELLKIIYDCYVVFGVSIDPQQHFTKENYSGDIDAAECAVWGWVMTSLIEEGYDEDGRWDALRGKVGECNINHLFYCYFGRPTPQPILPEEYYDFAFTPEDKGWTHLPVGFGSINSYLEWAKKQNIPLPDRDEDSLY